MTLTLILLAVSSPALALFGWHLLDNWATREQWRRWKEQETEYEESARNES